MRQLLIDHLLPLSSIELASHRFSIIIGCSLPSNSRLITSQALMASTTITSLWYCSLSTNFITHQKSTSIINLSKQFRSLAIKANFNSFLTRPDHSCNSFSKKFIIQRFSDYGVPNLVSTRSSSSIVRSYNGRNDSGGNPQPKDNGLDWPILRRWDVPWPWQTVSLSSLACGISQFCGHRIARDPSIAISWDLTWRVDIR